MATGDSMAILTLNGTRTEINAVGLDFNGVFRDDGYPSYEGCRDVIIELGGTPPESFDGFNRTITSDYDRFFRDCGIAGGERAFMAIYRERHERPHDSMPPFDDVTDLLRHLSEIGVKTFIVSGASQERILPWLEKHEMHEMLDRIACGSRNKTICITQACDTLGIEPECTIFVGDWGLDMEESRRAGCTPIGITRGHPSADALRHRGAAHVIEHLSELTKALLCAA